jgi:hypothetical protein
LQPSALRQPTIVAQPVAGLTGCIAQDASRRTLVLVNYQRMRSVYPNNTNDVTTLKNTLESQTFINSNNNVIIDLFGCVFQGNDVNHLKTLYQEWDNNADQPLYANEVAQQIWYMIDALITQKFPSIEYLVIVGGDNIIPFYRVPDETTLTNESTYFQQQRDNQGSLFANNTPLRGSLFYNFIQTDNFYADRQPTPWRGRALYIPDLAIGRLVEHPADINRYLTTTNNDLLSVLLELVGSLLSALTTSSNPGSAFVSGYDFLDDQANAVSSQLAALGFQLNPKNNQAKNTTLINDTWTSQDLIASWFPNNQISKFKDSYSHLQTNYQLASLNAHFTHYQIFSTQGYADSFLAERLRQPTHQPPLLDLSPTPPFFGAQKLSHGLVPTLIYSVGCHSGLNVINQQVRAGVPSSYHADFAEGVLKQGGNWIGNTGFGYGDSELIAYSERLSLLLTQALGRDVQQNNQYVGASIGESLVLAKQEYLRRAGPGSFSVFDEKVLSEMTLYGLPYLRVRVPSPANPSDFGEPAMEIPTSQRSNPGSFTRLITFTNTFEADPNVANHLQAHSIVTDSFLPNTSTSLTSSDMSLVGLPTLPLFDYSLTLKGNGTTSPEMQPQIRSVKLIQSQLEGAPTSNQALLTTITNETLASQNVTPELPAQLYGDWLPERFFIHQRIGSGNNIVDTLQVSPVQFQPQSTTAGNWRRYSQLVFEVTYLDPTTADLVQQLDTVPPQFGQVDVQWLANNRLRLEVEVNDDSNRVQQVGVLYSTNTLNWQFAALTPNGSNQFVFEIPAASPESVHIAMLTATDASGNIAFFESKNEATFEAQQAASSEENRSQETPTTTPVPTTAVPTTPVPTTAVPTTPVPTTAVPTTTPVPTTAVPTTPVPTTAVPTTTPDSARATPEPTEIVSEVIVESETTPVSTESTSEPIEQTDLGQVLQLEQGGVVFIPLVTTP